MSKFRNILAGLGGAVALNIIHEKLKHEDSDMPRIDLLGEEALQKGLEYFNAEIKDGETLYKATLAGDIISNSLYYSMIGVGDDSALWERAITYGLGAGIAAVNVPEEIGLDPEPVNDTIKTQALTVAYYLTGALVTAGIIKLFSKKEPQLELE